MRIENLSFKGLKWPVEIQHNTDEVKASGDLKKQLPLLPDI